jgi:hypothetical protein
MGSKKLPKWADDVIVEDLTVEEKNVRDVFVKQYLYDYDARSAIVRVGFSVNYAEYYADKFMAEPYVLRKILEQEQKQSHVEVTKKAKALVIRRLHEQANYKGRGSSHSARIAALSKLAQLYNMEPEKKFDLTGQSGVMAVPAMQSPKDWGEGAKDSQSKLKSKVKE